jgi:hypothetical protein
MVVIQIIKAIPVVRKILENHILPLYSFGGELAKYGCDSISRRPVSQYNAIF